MKGTYIQAIEAVPSYDANTLKAGIDSLFETLEILKDLCSDTRVLLKPNLLGDYNTFFSVTTNPAVVKAVAEWLLEHGVKNVLIADSPGGAVCRMPDFSFPDFYKKAGYAFLGDIPGVTLNTDGGWRSVPTPAGCALKHFNLLNAICDADYIINLPKLKTHNKTVISFGVKNLFGCVPDIQKPAFHAKYPRIADFANMLVELAMTVKPALTVIDAVEIMEHNGPVTGERRTLGLLCAAKDVFSQDAFLADLLGVDAEKTDLLRIAREKGTVLPAEIRSETFSVADRPAPLVLPDIFTANTVTDRLSSLFQMGKDKLAEKLFVATPSIDDGKCERCMRCLHSCPVGAISEKNGALRVDTEKCISCLCCAEVCTHGGVRVKNLRKRKRGK